jgi:hypothetical protein
MEFASPEQLHLHKVCRHCEHCLQTFDCRSALQSHLPECDRKPEASAENDASQLNTGAADSVEPTISADSFKCNSCALTFASELQLMMHVQVELVECGICRNDMHTGPEFLTHSAFRICTGCNVSFKCRARFDDHLGGGGAACSAETQVIKCSFCCSAQASDAEMGSHLAENTCHCGQRFSCRALMDTHRALTHDASESKPRVPRDAAVGGAVGVGKDVCTFCGKGYHKNNDFHHRRRWCKFCKVEMQCCNVMLEHEKCCAHKKLRQHECAECGKKFNTINRLKRHVKRNCDLKVERSVQVPLVVEPVLPQPEPQVVVAKPWVYEEDFEMVPLNPFGDMYD